MTDERLYDYSKGLNAPYWIQEIKTKKGTRLWYFATPMQLSFFIVFIRIIICIEFQSHAGKADTFLFSTRTVGASWSIFAASRLCQIVSFLIDRNHRDLTRLCDKQAVIVRIQFHTINLI